MKKILFLFVIISFIAGCTKNETKDQDIHIVGNIPPPDHTIDSSTIVIYVNKAYINMLGRKPIGAEQSSALTMLRTHNFSGDDRKQFIQTLFPKPEYNRTLAINANNQYLKGTDSATIDGQMQLYAYLASLPDYAFYYDQLQYEIKRMDTLKNVINYLNAGTMDYKGMLKKITDNFFYDQINMGTENFVISTYQNFLFRYPTASELTNGENMVNTLPSQTFLQTGQSKDDYIRIFFDSNDYYEGQVRYIFKQYLFREPSSAEIGYYANIYKSADYKQMQTVVFAQDEYAGLH